MPPPQEMPASLPGGTESTPVSDTSSKTSTHGGTETSYPSSIDAAMPTAASTKPITIAEDDLHSDISTQYPLTSSLPPSALPPSTFSPSSASTASPWAALKSRIALHYNLASEYYYKLWGEHIHHGYFTDSSDTKERAQGKLIELLLEKAELATSNGIEVLDVGCGLGGTSRRLARDLGARVTGVTISAKQVEMARKITAEEGGEIVAATNGETGEAEHLNGGAGAPETIALGSKSGSVSFVELDAEEMGSYFGLDTGSPDTNTKGRRFDCVWISEAMSHLPNKELFFRNAAALLRPGGKLVVADWFRAEGLEEKQVEADIRPIEDGMLLPPLCTQADYVRFAKEAELKVFAEPMDISKEVAPTWDISWSLVQSPALWAFALAQGRDGIAFLQAFRAMRRGYANGTFRYAVVVFGKES